MIVVGGDLEGQKGRCVIYSAWDGLYRYINSHQSRLPIDPESSCGTGRMLCVLSTSWTDMDTTI